MSDTKFYLGIEVGDASLKVALLDSVERRVLRTAILQTGTSPLDDVYTFESVLQGWLDTIQVDTVEATSVAIPAFRSIIRQVYVPAEACANREDYLEWYLGLITNAEKGSYIMDSQVLCGDNTVGETVLLIAVRREWVDGLRKGFRSKMLAPKAMEVDVLSLMNLMDSAERIDGLECVIKADFAGVTLMWVSKDRLQDLRCVSTLSLVDKSAEDAYGFLARGIREQIDLAKEDNVSFDVNQIHLCGELATDPLFMRNLQEAIPEYQISLMDSFSNLRLPVEEEDSAAVLSCSGAIGAALNLLEEA